jgi:hypothetical protein
LESGDLSGGKMVIAANFRKYPEAMALQFPLRLGKPRWHTSRPTTRLGRAVRAAIGRAVKAAAALTWAARLELAKIGKKIVPQWVKDAQSRARALGVWVREALMVLKFDQEEPAAPMQSGRTVVVELLGAAGPGAGLLKAAAADRG